MLKNLPPLSILLFGYILYTCFGWALLSLPVVQTEDVEPIDSLFIAASAVSTTGLTTVDVGTSYNGFGQTLILLLIQAGGIGFMTFSSFLLLATNHKLSRERAKVAKTAFALPDDFGPARFVWYVIRFTLLVELAGAIALWWIFSANDVERPLWNALFHSVSAFCTAGFSLFPDSLNRFSTSPAVCLVVSCLSFAGAIGFVVVADLWNRISGRQPHIHFFSRVVFRVTFWFVLTGTVLVYNLSSELRELPVGDGILMSFFQVMSATTTVGFSSVDVASFPAAVIMLFFFMMIFGASPSGTGGGLKSTTLATLVGLVNSTLKRRKSVTLYGRTLSDDHLRQATASLAFYLMLLFTAVLLLLVFEPSSLDALLFEAISALGTVGLSMGVTGNLTDPSKVLLVFLMLVGRIGVLSFGLAVSMEDEEPDAQQGEGELPL